MPCGVERGIGVYELEAPAEPAELEEVTVVVLATPNRLARLTDSNFRSPDHVDLRLPIKR